MERSNQSSVLPQYLSIFLYQAKLFRGPVFGSTSEIPECSSLPKKLCPRVCLPQAEGGTLPQPGGEEVEVAQRKFAHTSDAPPVTRLLNIQGKSKLLNLSELAF